MTDKPKPKREAAVVSSSEGARLITINASRDALADFSDFGTISQPKEDYISEYYLWVDARYDFNEVLNYIQNYG